MSSFMAAIGLGFNVNKAKPALQMCVSRLNININKKTNQVKAKRREVGMLLREQKEEKARIRVEAVIREDFTIEAYEILALLCELLTERIRLVDAKEECPPDLMEAVCTLIWATDRAEISELEVIRSQFRKKYGAEFVKDAQDNIGSCVNDRVVVKLGVNPPSALLVEAYLREIAKEYGVEWAPPEAELADIETLATQAAPAPTGYSVAGNAHEEEIQALRRAAAEPTPPPAAAPGMGAADDRGDFGPRLPPKMGGPPATATAATATTMGTQTSSTAPAAPTVPTVPVVPTAPAGGDAKPAAAPGFEPEADAPPPATEKGSANPPPSTTTAATTTTTATTTNTDGDDGDGGGAAAAGGAGGAGGQMDYASLAARFEALKK